MLPTTSPQKRKFNNSNEYRDPDYENGRASTSKRSCDQPVTSNATNSSTVETDKRMARICAIIAREFHHESACKQQQLEEIEQRLQQARRLLDRLRYAIVADYYRKQEVPLTVADAAMVRGKQTLFDDEPQGPQMPLHPSLKKIIGKQPRGYTELLARGLPERAAAQNAMHTIRARSQAKRKQERQLQQLIREQGLVIDHSKDVTAEVESNVAAFQARQNAPATSSTKAMVGGVVEEQYGKPQGALNATRLNNKVKHIIVIGNTSKYIGGENDMDTEQKMALAHTMSHKWLVYVQSKERTQPLELFVKKVRFFLHASYRPNDIVDVTTPPFQIARRGWGEFPVRIQLAFHEHLQQKPVQLVHNLVLDRSLSGLHTMGAETLMEIWLRDLNVTQISAPVPEPITTTITTTTTTATTTISSTCSPVKESSLKPRCISFNENKAELDDNLLAFLNKIEATPAALCADDIEKLQPTVVVTEPLAAIASSPTKMQTSISNSRKKDEAIRTNTATTANRELANCVERSTPTKPLVHNKPLTVPKTVQQKPFVVRLPHMSATPMTNNAGQIDRTKLMQVTKGNLVTLQTTNGTISHPKTSPATLATAPATAKPVLQKKLVQLVDKTGKVKLVQMLVATAGRAPTVASANSRAPNIQSTKPTIAAAPTAHATNRGNIVLLNAKQNLNNQLIKSNSPSTIPAKTQNSSGNHSTNNVNSSSKFTTGSTKNVVFQKEGKLYIIDPLQMKLKQQQKQQVSLLKPQVSLLKQQQSQQQQQQLSPQSFAMQSIASDHDYTPARMPRIPPAKSHPASLTSTSQVPLSLNNNNSNSSNKANPIQTHSPSLHLGIRQTRANANNIFEQKQKQRIQYEQHFLHQRCSSMRAAVEFLLRRLPLIAPKPSPIAAFPFISSSLKEFHALPALKQRACEWLRAKCVVRCMRNHRDLQQLHASGEDTYWSTREVLLFARCNAYTPVMKMFDLLPAATGQDNNAHEPKFAQLVKSEVKQEQQNYQYDTLTTHARIANWVEEVWASTSSYQQATSESQVIDIISIDDHQTMNSKNAPKRDDCDSLKNTNTGKQIYMPVPERLETEAQLVADICRDFSIRLQPESIVEEVLQPVAQTLLAQCLQVFVERLVRRATATKVQNKQPATTTSSVAIVDESLQLETCDIAKAIALHDEFDFLRNSHLGAISHEKVEQ